MATDWKLIREVLDTVIDSCERLERNGYTGQHRDISIDVGESSVSVCDFMVSAWTLPENVLYQIIRQRTKAQNARLFAMDTAER
ncbi:hypothetical protein ISP15_11565 [Dyella jejuensis]|uniref:Uncharacterized protein n=1 Tax=Dyella jejuensis TaxID=1432009 RepID=A0ABW8JIR0_9GAMM